MRSSTVAGLMFTMAAARVMLPDHRGGLGDWACHLTRPHLRVDPSCAAWIAANRIDAAAAIMGRGRSSSSERGGDKRKKKSKKDDHRRDRVRDQAAGRNAIIYMAIVLFDLLVHASPFTGPRTAPPGREGLG